MTTYKGTTGDDSYQGTVGKDTLSGLAGDDFLAGLGGADVLDGGEGDDVLYGAATSGSSYQNSRDADDGADTLRGGNGNDLLRGALGDDKLYGGAGEDNLRGDIGKDLLDGGDGDDFASYFVSGYSEDIKLDISGFVAGRNFTFIDQFGDKDTLVSIERLGISGSLGNDTLIGSIQSDQITIGGGGKDAASGGGGDDILLLSPGNVTAKGEAGDDGIQIDAYMLDYSTPAGKMVIDGGAGTDSVDVVWQDFTSAITMTVSGSTTKISSGDVTASITNVEKIAVYGGSGADKLTGGSADDVLSGGDGKDTLKGGAGDDRISGGAGDDVLDGGAGRDLYLIDAGPLQFAGIKIDASKLTLAGTITDLTGDTDTIKNFEGFAITGGYGNDTLTGSSGGDELDGGYGKDSIKGGAGDDLINLTTTGTNFPSDPSNPNGQTKVTEGGDTIDGGTGTDTVSFATLSQAVKIDLAAGKATVAGDATHKLTSIEDAVGGGGNDTLTGNKVANHLSGGDGNDTLSGGEGNDVLIGGAGKDTLTGSYGNDTYVFASGDTGATKATADAIAAFAKGDKIDLSAIDAIPGGVESKFTFLGTAAFSGHAGELRAYAEGGHTFVAADLDGNKSVDLLIDIGSKVTLAATDFVL
jgi:Ca2+-binding RTX toxin-like protein